VAFYFCPLGRSHSEVTDTREFGLRKCDVLLSHSIKSPSRGRRPAHPPTPSLPLCHIDNIRHGHADHPRPNLRFPGRATRIHLGFIGNPPPPDCWHVPPSPPCPRSLLLNRPTSRLQMMRSIDWKAPARSQQPHLERWSNAPRILPALLLTTPALFTHGLPVVTAAWIDAGSWAYSKCCPLGPVVGLDRSSGLYMCHLSLPTGCRLLSDPSA